MSPAATRLAIFFFTTAFLSEQSYRAGWNLAARVGLPWDHQAEARFLTHVLTTVTTVLTTFTDVLTMVTHVLTTVSVNE